MEKQSGLAAVGFCGPTVVRGGGGVEGTARRSQSCCSLGENVTKASAKHRLGEIVAMYHKTPKQGDKHYIHKKHTATK